MKSTAGKVLITGSSGMLGIDLANELRRGYELIGTDIFKSQKSKVRGQRYFCCDITDRKKITAIIEKTRPDVVVHTAAWTDVDGCELDKDKAYAVNSGGVRNVALACKAIDAKLIYMSTDFVFDGRNKRPYRENDRANPLGVYADSKLKGEAAVKKALKRYF
ncbi:MAG: SDR family oxidoreductase, partial [Candidatus Omnitrophica bacterium]|nr:SDR family oxidoreductase [Candidatus Omnitrophota bacterium]